MLIFGAVSGLVFGGCVLAGKERRFLGKIVHLSHLEAKSSAVKAQTGAFGPYKAIGAIYFAD